MKGIINKLVAAALCLGSGLCSQAAWAQCGGGGCGTAGCGTSGCGIAGRFGGDGEGCYRKCVDQCWPERYNYMARKSVMMALNNQAYNGHVLDQTVWNYMFENDPKTGGTARLNAYGLAHLAYLARRRPNPDPRVYLQTAQDISYNQAQDPMKFVQSRMDLDKRRVKAVQDFLQAQTASRNLGYDFDITVHDPAEVGIAAIPIGGNQPATLYRVFGSVPQLQGNFRGILPSNAGGGFGSSGGGGGGGVSGGTGGGGGGGGQPGGAGSSGGGTGGSGTY